MGTYERFLEIIRNNLEKKHTNKQYRNKILERIKEKYKDSPLFAEPVPDEEGCRSVCQLGTTNCFGKHGFSVLDSIPRSERIEVLRECYQDEHGSVFPEEQIINAIDERGKFGRTQFHDAIKENDRAGIKSLLKAGADPFIKDNNGCTPYMLARLDDNVEMSVFLERLGIYR